MFFSGRYWSHTQDSQTIFNESSRFRGPASSIFLVVNSFRFVRICSLVRLARVFSQISHFRIFRFFDVQIVEVLNWFCWKCGRRVLLFSWTKRTDAIRWCFHKYYFNKWFGICLELFGVSWCLQKQLVLVSGVMDTSTKSENHTNYGFASSPKMKPKSC